MCSLQAPSSSRPIIANTLYDIDAMDDGTLAAVDTEIESLPAALRARLGTTQSAVARLEGGRVSPSIATLRRYAEATGTRLTVGLQQIAG